MNYMEKDHKFSPAWQHPSVLLMQKMSIWENDIYETYDTY